MQYTTLGRTGLRVSRIAFGTWQLGGDWGPTDESAAIAAIRRAADHGVTLFDTAQAYGFGASERQLAKALTGLDRGKLVIATKGGLRPADGGGVRRDSSPAWIRTGVESSLRALNTDYVDLYQVHWHARDLRAVSALARIAGHDLGVPVSRLAVAWTLANPAVHTTIVGTRNPDHIDDAIAAADLELGPELLAGIDAIAGFAARTAGPTPDSV